MKLHTKMLVGLVTGAALGLVARAAFGGEPWLEEIIKNVIAPVGQVFLRLIFMVVVPLVFSSLVLGVLEVGDVKQLGRVGIKALVYSLFASAASVVIGIALVHLVRPGAGLDASLRDKLVADFSKQSGTAIQNAKAAKPIADSLLELIPKNPIAAAVDALNGEMLALMIFAVIFAIAYSRVRDAETEAFAGWLRGVQRASMRVIDWAMALAPYAVGALLFTTTARTGFSLFASLGSYVLVVVLGLAIQQFVVFFAVLKLIGRVSPLEWWRRVREVVLTAFSTASSNATLPTSLKVSEEKLGVAPRIGTFVLTVGSTANQNGTALFEGVTVLFLAQVFGVDLSLGQQVSVVVMAILAGVGTAGVPGGSLPLIVLVLQSVGIPPEGIGIILGVDRFLDMCRTVINVTGDLVAATVIAKTEGELRFDGGGVMHPWEDPLDALARVALRGTAPRQAVRRLTAAGRRHELEARVDPAALAALDRYSDFSWVPLRLALTLTDAIYATLGSEEANTAFWRAHLLDLASSPLLKGLAQSTLSLFGATPAVLYKLTLRGWGLSYKNFGAMSIEALEETKTTGRIVLVLGGVPHAAFASGSYGPTTLASMLGVTDFALRPGTGRILESPKPGTSNGRLVMEIRW